MAKKKLQEPNGAGLLLKTTVLLPQDLNQRLARFMLEKFAGRMHVRNRVILEALEEKLKKEGF